MDYEFPMWNQLRPFDPKPHMNIAPRCPCVSTACPRHGFCEACKEYHAKYQDHPPTCQRPETWKKGGNK